MATLTLTSPAAFVGRNRDLVVSADYVMNPDNFTVNDNRNGYAGLSNFRMSADMKTMYIDKLNGVTGTQYFQVKDNTSGAVVTSNELSYSVGTAVYDNYSIGDGLQTATLKVLTGRPVVLTGPIPSAT